ncbi:LysR family transcriptional regulator, partial [Ectothiorhodospira shaposhnikovii]|uniref:LysR substrate-binding domain-containing protein n=1 Tax=Ectothiorhodospira shaposhnikovii TaxID=1054 RepID=UPI001F5BA390
PSHPLAKKGCLSIEEILPFPFIFREEGSGTREVIMDYLVAQGVDRNALAICLELGSPEAIKGAVEAGMGVSILSRSTIDKELALERLVGIPLEPPLTRQFSFVHQRQKFRLRAMDELLSFARDYCETQSAAEGERLPSS